MKTPGRGASSAWLCQIFGVVFALFGLGMLTTWGAGPETVALYTCAVSVALLLFYEGNPFNLWVGFAVPWMLMLASTLLSISEYSRPLDIRTAALVSFLLLLLAVFVPRDGSRIQPISSQSAPDRRIALLFLAFVLFSALNVAYSGFLPAIRLITDGDSGYRDFGLPSFNGFANAYANALAVTSFYLWCTKRRKVFLLGYIAILASFVLLVSRQNLVSVAVESFVVYNLTVRRIRGLTIILSGALFLSVFSLIGNARLGEGSIVDMAKIQDEWEWLPDAGVWLYAYSYFNLLNIDNVLQLRGTPPFDLSSLATLIPSVLRPAGSPVDTLLEVSAFTTGSFIKPIVADIGWQGLVTVFVLFALWGRQRATSLSSKIDYRNVCSYSTIYFCFAFSFFENFWFYLPIIFQLAFFKLFEVVLFQNGPAARSRRISPGASIRWT